MCLVLCFPWDQYLLTSLYSSATWRCSFPEPCEACFTINLSVSLSAYSSACWLAQRPTGVSSECKCKPLGCVRDCMEIIVFLVCWSLAIVVLRSGGVSEGPALQGVCETPGIVCFFMQGQLLVALCALWCVMVVVKVFWACISSLALPKSLISACLGRKKICLPYSLTVLESRLCSSHCQRS